MYVVSFWQVILKKRGKFEWAIGVIKIYWSPPISMLSLRTMGASNVELLLRQDFAFKVSDLELWHDYLKNNRGHLILRAIGAGNVELSLEQAFCVQGHCDLDLRPDDLKINRGHLLVIPSLRVKFEGHGCRQCRVITRTSFLRSKSLWSWPLTRWAQNQ